MALCYRKLLKCSKQVSRDCGLQNATGLEEYLGRRFREIATRNKTARATRKSLQAQSKALDEYIVLLQCAAGNVGLTSMLQVLAGGVGNQAYQRAVEKGFVDMIRHEDEKVRRNENDDESASERQNRLVQNAVLPYAVRLASLSTNSQPSSSISSHTVDHGVEKLVVDIDDEINKQTIFVECGEFDVRGEVERIESMECEGLRKTVAHAEYLSIALRLFESLKEETPIHRSRACVVVGHGVGGAVGLLIGCLLHSSGFEVRNVVTLGSPKSLVVVPERLSFAINPLRIVIAGDPAPEMPVSAADGEPFIQVGEILLLGGKVDDYSLQSYVALLGSAETSLTYAEGDDVWDEGDYATSMKESAEKLPKMASSQWSRDREVPV